MGETGRVDAISTLAAADEVVVVRGAGYNPKRRKDSDRLAVVRQSEAIREIARLLSTTKPESDARDWMEWPEISFAFVAVGEVVGEVGLLSHAEWARHERLGDVELLEPEHVRAWLAARNIPMT